VINGWLPDVEAIADETISAAEEKKSGTVCAAPRAWIAEGCANEDGYQLGPQDRPALSIYAISVRDSLSVAIDERLCLMTTSLRVARSGSSSVASLWIFPAGYFGFSAVRSKWQPLDVQACRLLEREFIDRARHFPAPSLIAVVWIACDSTVWVAQRHRHDVSVSKVTRGKSQLAGRQFIPGRDRPRFSSAVSSREARRSRRPILTSITMA